MSKDNSSEFASLLYYLREGEGDSITLLCDNPDFNGQPNNAVECCGAWTDWKDRRFTGDSLVGAVRTAAVAKAALTGALVPAAPQPADLRERVDASEIINRATDDLSIAPHWHEGRTAKESLLLDTAFQNGVEAASDAILSALQHSPVEQKDG